MFGINILLKINLILWSGGMLNLQNNRKIIKIVMGIMGIIVIVRNKKER